MIKLVKFQFRDEIFSHRHEIEFKLHTKEIKFRYKF